MRGRIVHRRLLNVCELVPAPQQVVVRYPWVMAVPGMALCPSYVHKEMSVNKSIALLLVATLAGCGVDSMSAAATAAAAKKKEVEQGQKNMEQAKQNINQALDLSKQGTERSADAADK